MTKQLPPLHPGEILREEFILPYGLTAGKVAKACGVPRTRIERIVNEEKGLSGDTALRLAKFFRTSPEFWMNLQSLYEVQVAKREIGEKIEEIEPIDIAD
ncbi:HigA family addiction module antitoxin [Methyloferula stellata]|uniref:HigA family addiction module antitoxin n=1 Tax=Methyloferula stellata TaxID=876270 RepID=UPI000378DCF1|nr:HigA family addiction module antitoxin [Methyloferula stellata]